MSYLYIIFSLPINILMHFYICHVIFFHFRFIYCLLVHLSVSCIIVHVICLTTSIQLEIILEVARAFLRGYQHPDQTPHLSQLPYFHKLIVGLVQSLYSQTHIFIQYQLHSYYLTNKTLTILAMSRINPGTRELANSVKDACLI